MGAFVAERGALVQKLREVELACLRHILVGNDETLMTVAAVHDEDPVDVTSGWK